MVRFTIRVRVSVRVRRNTVKEKSKMTFLYTQIKQCVSFRKIMFRIESKLTLTLFDRNYRDIFKTRVDRVRVRDMVRVRVTVKVRTKTV